MQTQETWCLELTDLYAGHGAPHTYNGSPISSSRFLKASPLSQEGLSEFADLSHLGNCVEVHSHDRERAFTW